jgi:hypothetical protein
VIQMLYFDKDSALIGTGLAQVRLEVETGRALRIMEILPTPVSKTTLVRHYFLVLKTSDLTHEHSSQNPSQNLRLTINHLG